MGIMVTLTFEQVRHVVELSFPGYAPIRSTYWRSVNDAVGLYLLDSTKDESWFRSVMQAIVGLAFTNAALAALVDTGEDSHLTVSLLSLVTAYKLAEFGFVESLILSLRLVKYPSTEIIDDEEVQVEAGPDEIQAMEVARKRADGYSQGLDILYNNVKVRAAGERILLFTGYDGMESCFDCQKYKGLRKPASWWVANNAIPPNRDFECKGYNCMHVLQDVTTGKLFTI